MELKIGEIFEFGGEWYQCVKSPDGSCKHCDMNFGGKCPIPIKECVASSRSDLSYVIFKKLEKVGEPIEFARGLYFQRYRLAYSTAFYEGDTRLFFSAPTNTFVYIEIKQNEEDMEEIEWKTEKIEQYSRGKRPKISGQEELNLKPFDLEAAKQGKPVCTRDGRKARIICFDAKKDMPLVALITNKDIVENKIGDTEEVHFYYEDGRCNKYQEYRYDLMMLPEKKEGWVNVYKTDCGIILSKQPYTSKEEALKHIGTVLAIVDTIKISWEE